MLSSEPRDTTGGGRGSRGPGRPDHAERRAEAARLYEDVAVRLFAERGFHTVTVADVAAAAGVTSRTLFRYFPTKEDMLLAGPRRATRLLVDAISRVRPAGEPIGAVWNLLIDLTVRYGVPVEVFADWYRAAADVPEVVTRMRGERATAIEDALTGLFADWMGVDPTSDVRPRVLAAALHASEQAVLRHYLARGGKDDLIELFAVASDAVRGLAATLHPG